MLPMYLLITNLLPTVIISGNPNNGNVTTWPTYTNDAEMQLRFEGTGAVVEEDDMRRAATDFWRSIPEVLMH